MQVNAMNGCIEHQHLPEDRARCRMLGVTEEVDKHF